MKPFNQIYEDFDWSGCDCGFTVIYSFTGRFSRSSSSRKGEVVLEKAGEIELGDLIQQWASEMDHVYAETRIQAKDSNKKIFERLGINDKAFVRYVNSIKGKENPFARLQKGRLIQALPDADRRSHFSARLPSD